MFGLDPATGKILWSKSFAGKDLRSRERGAGPGVRRYRRGQLAVLDTRDRHSSCGRYKAPDKTACGPSIVDGRVLWGYGFMLFGGAAKGGVISFSIGT